MALPRTRYRRLLSEKSFLRVAERARRVTGVQIVSIEYGRSEVVIKCNSVSRPGLIHTQHIQIMDLQDHKRLEQAKKGPEKGKKDFASQARKAMVKNFKNPIAGKRLEQAILDSPIRISCSCEAWLFWGYKYMAWKRGYGLYPEHHVPHVRNPRQQGALCLDENTTVITSEGEKTLKEVKVGDLVLTHKGRFRRVIEKAESQKECVEIKYGYQTLVGSAEHRLLVGRNDNKHSRTYDPFNSTVEYRSIGSIQEGDFLFSPKVDLSGTEEVSEGLAWFLGLYIADGTLQYKVIPETSRTTKKIRDDLSWKGISISFDRRYEDKYMVLFRKYGILPRRVAYTKTNTANFLFNDVQVVEFCIRYGSFTSERYGFSKKIDPAVLNWSEGAKDALVEGFFLGDGTIVPGSGSGNSYITLFNTNKQVMGMLAILTSKFKTMVLRSYDRKPFEQNGRVVTPKTMYYLRFIGPDASYFYNKFRDDVACKSFSGDHSFGQTGFTESQYGRVMPISAITKVGIRNCVDLGVEEDETYVANGVISHNCKHLYAVLSIWPLLAKTVARRIKQKDEDYKDVQ